MKISLKQKFLCGRETVQIRPSQRHLYNFDELEKRLKKQGKSGSQSISSVMSASRASAFVILQDGRVFIHGTNDIQFARSLYYRLLG